jgi:hypothetical protein
MLSKTASRKDQIALAYAKLAKKLKSYPSRSDLIKKANISRDMIRDHFGDMESLKEYAKNLSPKSFENVISPEVFSTQVFDDLKEQAKKYKRFIVTTAVAGAPVHKNFLDSLKNYCSINKAMFLLIPANYALYDIDPELIMDSDINIVFKPLKLNSNIYIDPIKIDPKQVDPVVGLDALGQTDGTVIIGSPKQRRVPVANSNTKLARIIQSTGAITRPRYIPSDKIPKRRDRLAEAHHKMGAIVIEIVDDVYYHFRPIQMCKDGSFNDLFYKYSPDGKKSFIGCEAIIQGDYHVTETDPLVDKAVDEMCALGKPKYRVFHDFFSGVSINHHEIKNKVLRARLASENRISLEKELEENAKVIKEKQKLKTSQKLVFAKSNHDEFLDRYLADGKFDDINRVISTKLQVLAMEGKDPLKAALEMMGVKFGSDIIWLERDQDFRVAGIELGAHGDLGANGKKNPGSKGMYKAYGKVIYGHCHYGEMWHEAWSVGTSTHRKLSYNRGASSWDNSQAIVYSDGTRQLINVIEGKWRL